MITRHETWEKSSLDEGKLVRECLRKTIYAVDNEVLNQSGIELVAKKCLLLPWWESEWYWSFSFFWFFFLVQVTTSTLACHASLSSNMITVWLNWSSIKTRSLWIGANPICSRNLSNLGFQQHLSGSLNHIDWIACFTNIDTAERSLEWILPFLSCYTKYI